MIQSGLSSSVLAIIIVVLILLAVKEFVESMNDKQDAANHREKIEEKVDEKVEELKEQMKEAKAERQSNYRDMLTWQNVTLSLFGVLVILLVVLFVINYNNSQITSRLGAATQAFFKIPGTAVDYVVSPAISGVSKVVGGVKSGGGYVLEEARKGATTALGLIKGQKSGKESSGGTPQSNQGTINADNLQYNQPQGGTA